MKLIKRFRKGFGVIDSDFIDFYINDEGNLVKHHWGNGGQSKVEVDCIPESIDGYEIRKF